jgi:molybdopterin/thiamine biosynthesis adenylyltransferase
MVEYYHRQIQLWGQDTQNTLKDKKVAIIGSGGLGSSLGIALSGSGIGEFYLVDFDDIATHNIHRQIAFSIGDEGSYKSDKLATIMKNRNPYINVTSITKSFDKFSLMGIEVDLIIDATDNLPTRVKIDNYANKCNIPWIYGSVEAFNGQVCFFDKSSFGDSFNTTEHTPAGITPPIVMQIASFQANIALRYLAGLSIEKDTLYYLFFNENGEFVTQKFRMKI